MRVYLDANFFISGFSDRPKDVAIVNYDDMKEWLYEVNSRLQEWIFNDMPTQEDIAMLQFTTGLVLGKVKEREDWGMDGEPMYDPNEEEDDI